MENSTIYESPKVVTIQVFVEQGFAASLNGSGEDISGPDDWGSPSL